MCFRTYNPLIMNAIIVEDEPLAVQRLEQLLYQYDSSIKVVFHSDSIVDSVGWLRKHPMPDLGFFDIQLSDGLSFSIFKQLHLSFPVIFTTAYDQYAIEAFKVNSIDYLLKPIDAESLATALNKLNLLKLSFSPIDPRVFERIGAYKTRFLAHSGHQILSISTQDVRCFHFENKVVWLKHLNGNKYALDATLDQLEHQLNPDDFFRVNRQFILSHKGIRSVANYTNGRLKIVSSFDAQGDEIVVSRDRVPRFKNWLDGFQ